MAEHSAITENQLETIQELIKAAEVEAREIRARKLGIKHIAKIMDGENEKICRAVLEVNPKRIE